MLSLIRSQGGETLERDDGARASRGLLPAPFLFAALACDEPLAPPMRVALADVDELVLARGPRGVERRARGEGGAQVTLRLPDRRMSSVHATLRRELGGFVLEDAGSTNGTLLNGAAVTRARLADGDCFELGHTFFVYRSALPAPSAARDLDAATLASTPPGLRTLIPSLAQRFDELSRLSRSDVAIVLGGESGTGKELVARAVHLLSGRRGALVAVNCGALPAALVESELFGAKKGAFSGADADRPGLVRAADRGTLFLDEIGDLPLAAQAALLRVLQEGEVLPLGGSMPVPVDVRVVVASHRDLPALVAAGKFRADLLARLNGWSMTLPPLRERREDLGLIAGEILRRAGGEAAPSLTWDAARALFAHQWPLNARELDKLLTTALVLSGGRIERTHLAALDAPIALPVATSPSPASELSDADRRLRDALVDAMAEHRGNVNAVARTMGKAPVQIRRWVKRLAVDVHLYRR
jgi:sigma-54 dependent transcriptional regulator, acetoin dehydrogenase operon transcriptional activator AcoR